MTRPLRSAPFRHAYPSGTDYPRHHRRYHRLPQGDRLLQSDVPGADWLTKEKAEANATFLAFPPGQVIYLCISVLSNRILSSGYFPFPAHGEPGQGSARRQSSVLAGKLFFATPPRYPLPVFNASADTDCCSLPRFFGDGVLFAANPQR